MSVYMVVANRTYHDSPVAPPQEPKLCTTAADRRTSRARRGWLPTISGQSLSVSHPVSKVKARGP